MILTKHPILILLALAASIFGKEDFLNTPRINEMHQAPQYLYKILPLRNWLATQSRKTLLLPAEDTAFVHLSTEDGLEKVLKKYWADAPQFVILKLLSSQLEGKLVYEISPGGAFYYHLYDGFIPFDAIAEAKIVYREPIQASEANQLEIVPIGHRILRQKARELSFEEILSPEIQELIEKMKATMRGAPGVGLAAPQIGEPIQLAVIEDMDHHYLTDQELKERDRRLVPFHVIINPRLYIEEEAKKLEFFEGCLSISDLIGIVPRAESVRVECLNEQGKPTIIYAKGWYARILQHEIDHLNGALFLDKADMTTLVSHKAYEKLYKGKSIKEVQTILHANE